MKGHKKLAALGFSALVAGGLVAAPSVEITNVQQQYPWTNTVDITYTVQGVKSHQTNRLDHIVNETYFATFEAKDSGGNAISDVNGNTVFTNGLVNGSCTETAQWHPATNLQLTGCTITPSVFRGEEKAYMVINLVTNAQGKYDWWYEPMSTQEASNTRYNTDEYKTTKLVLRRIAKGVYWMGGPENSSTKIYQGINSRHQVNMAQDYYIAIFPTTEAQWSLILNNSTTVTSGLPKGAVSWNTIRGSAGAGTYPSDSCILGLLNERTNLKGFDLPTESMWEVAARAGCMTKWLCGDTATNLAKWGYIGANYGSRIKVGLRLPNAWGIFDVHGNTWEHTRDQQNTGDLAVLQPEGLTPITNGTAGREMFRSASSCDTAAYHRLSSRHTETCTTQGPNCGFRISYFPQ